MSDGGNGSVWILHLTDVHFDGSMAQRSSWRELLAFLRRFPHPVSAVALTGDVANRNASEGYTFAEEFLPLLANALRIPTEAVYVVPGNHDLDRRHADAVQASPTTLGTRLKEARDILEYPFKRFVAAMTAAKVSYSIRPTLFFCNGIKFICLNSCWLARHSEQDHGKLALSVGDCAGVLGPKPASDAPLTVALMHHALEWLHPSENTHVETMLAMHADIVLCGHDHVEASKVIKKSGYSFLIVRGQTSGAEDMPYHRGTVCEIRPDRTAYLHQIVRDPSREGTVDEWYFRASAIPHELARVDERAMSAVELDPADQLGTALRGHWSKVFQKDVLLGSIPDQDPRDLVVIYRKLSLAHLRDDAASDARLPLWWRLHNYTTDINSARIFELARSLVAGRDLEATLAGSASLDDVQLSGHPAKDGERLALATADTCIKEKLHEWSGRDDDLKFTMQAIAADASVVNVLKKALGARDLVALVVMLLLRERDIAGEQQSIADSHALASQLIQLVAYGHGGTSFLVEWSRFLLFLTPSGMRRVLAPVLSDAVWQQIEETGIWNPEEFKKLRQDGPEGWERNTLAKIVDHLAIYELVLTESVLNTLCELELGSINDGIVKAITPSVVRQAAKLLLLSRCGKSVGSRPEAIALSVCLHAFGPDKTSDQMLDNSSPQLQDVLRLVASAYVAKRDIIADGIPLEYRPKLRHAVEQSYRRILLQDIDSPALSLEEVRIRSSKSGGRDCLAIVGGPGTGKTTLLRHLCMTCSADDMPIFVALRRWNTSGSLTSCIDDSLREVGVSLVQIDKYLRSGKAARRVLFLLDGLDEVKDPTAGMRLELLRFLEDWGERSQTIITCRSTATEWLPDVPPHNRYALNRLTTNDVTAFLFAWHRDDQHRARALVEKVVSDCTLLEELRTPFVLRMYCAMASSSRGDGNGTPWGSRTDLYREIIDHLLDGRDRLRGLKPDYPLAEKRTFLSLLGRLSFEAEHVDVTSIFEAARTACGKSSEEAVPFLREIVDRSNLLVRISNTEMDFTHFTIREYFAAHRIVDTSEWTAWNAESARPILSHESVGRFMIGMNPQIMPSVIRLLEASLEHNPVRELVIAESVLDVFGRMALSSQQHALGRLLEAALKNHSVASQGASALVTQMFLRSGEQDHLATTVADWVSSNLLSADDLAARAITLASGVRHPAVVSSIATVLTGKVELADVACLAMASMDVDAAGPTARSHIAKGHVALLRACLRHSEQWTAYLQSTIESVLRITQSIRTKNQSLAKAQLLSVDNLLGDEDALQALQSSGFRLLEWHYGKPSIEGDTMAIVNALGPAQLTELEKLAERFVRASSECSGPVDLADFPVLTDALASALGVVVRRRERKQSVLSSAVSEEHVLHALADSADNVAVELLCRFQAEWSGDRKQLVEQVLHGVLERLRSWEPQDISELAFQLVDDLWVGASGDTSALARAKAERAQRVAEQRGISRAIWDAASAVATGLPRRPNMSDWAYLQHRFGGLIGALYRGKGRDLGREVSVPSEEGWEAIRACVS